MNFSREGENQIRWRYSRCVHWLERRRWEDRLVETLTRCPSKWMDYIIFDPDQTVRWRDKILALVWSPTAITLVSLLRTAWSHYAREYENGVLFLRLGLPSTLLCHENILKITLEWIESDANFCVVNDLRLKIDSILPLDHKLSDVSISFLILKKFKTFEISFKRFHSEKHLCLLSCL